MKDYIVRATAANAQIRAFAMTSRALVEEARQCMALAQKQDQAELMRVRTDQSLCDDFAGAGGGGAAGS